MIDSPHERMGANSEERTLTAIATTTATVTATAASDSTPPRVHTPPPAATPITAAIAALTSPPCPSARTATRAAASKRREIRTQLTAVKDLTSPTVPSAATATRTASRKRRERRTQLTTTTVLDQAARYNTHADRAQAISTALTNKTIALPSWPDQDPMADGHNNDDDSDDNGCDYDALNDDGDYGVDDYGC